MAPIFFRQDSSNIKIGTVCQRQGGLNPEMPELYMRQGTANPLVYQKTSGDAFSPIVVNCDAALSEDGTTVTLTPFNAYDPTRFYAVLKHSGVTEDNFYVCSGGSSQNYGAVSFYWLGADDLGLDLTNLTSFPDPYTNNPMFAIYGRMDAGGYGGMVQNVFAGGSIIDSMGMNHDATVNIDKMGNNSWTVMYSMVDNIGMKFGTMASDKKPFEGLCLIWANGTEGGSDTPQGTYGPMSFTVSSGQFLLS